MKTDLTRQAEKCLWHYTKKMGVFGCFEVTIGWFGKERVDFMTYSTDNTIRCYEIKVTLADLKSSAKQTFLGDYNYLVVTNELWEKIQADPDLKWKYSNQGILIFSELRHNLGITSVKKAKKQNVTLGTRATVLESMVRSLNREVEKFYKVKPFWGLSEEAK
ncbi:hypothetical protein EY695_02090 [Enterococcus faecalis]|uniref:hypothetical protein n=1 Tax=Enterococcus faecalis TaxID=1351 RepID=UPI001AD7BE9D|nr:hypothetical protein [Enterococcus faecalis]EJW9248671.1 hypothetical protein [Enterococcus faecalis]MBO6342171.1 hypothetical protein [Enterococcus faecalis]MBO6361616.1 hypothetical protein [Enterococcus faecalis]